MMMLCIFPKTINAQNFCENETTFFLETFGTGTTASSNADIITSALTYQATGDLFNEGVYRVINNTQQKSDWHSSPDHTGDLNGKMLVINGNGNKFYSHTINRPAGFTAGDYAISMFFMNINRVNLCGPGIILPHMTFIVEYQAQDNSWVSLGGSPSSTTAIPLTQTPVWVHVGRVLALPFTGSFVVQNIRVSISDGNLGGCGNDYALDDIRFGACPANGPLPVQFSAVSAIQKGSAVSVNWSTSSEINNKYFDVEKSANGASDWVLVSTTKSAGNNGVLKNYSTLDLTPAPGLNYYRVKQVDINGSYRYSSVVYVRMAINKTIAHVITNPIFNDIAVRFLTEAKQQVSVKLFDMTGKMIGTEKWQIPAGATIKTFVTTTNIQKGIYILNITDATGRTIYNGKLLK
jgi:hypothetical protein